MKKKSLVIVLICSLFLILFTVGCDSKSGISSEKATVQDFKTMSRPEEGWTIGELLSVSYVCGKQLSYPMTGDCLSPKLTIGLDSAVDTEDRKRITADLLYKKEYLGTCIYYYENDDKSKPVLISSISNGGPEYKYPDGIVVNGIKIGCSRAEIIYRMGEPDVENVNSSFYFIKYFDKNDDTKGVFFNYDSVEDCVVGIWIEG